MVGKRWRHKCSVRKPHFFKILLGDFNQSLRIPPNFVKYIPEETSREATLHGPNGSSWHVKLNKTIEGTFLSSGWSKFVKDHSLGEYDFLVFRYDGNMHFSVQVFDTTACERDYVLLSKTSTTPVSHGERRRKNTTKKISLDTDPSLRQSEIKSESQKLLAKEAHAANHLKDYPSNSVKGRCGRSSESNEPVKIKVEVNEVPSCMLVPDNKPTRGNWSSRRPVTLQERLKAQEVANSFSSKFPYFVSRMSASNVYMSKVLRFPTGFSQEHLPRSRTNLVLQDPAGKAWIVGYIPGFRDLISRGWSAFARGTNLEEGDFCAFELVSPLELCVHIFRVVETPSKYNM